MTCVAAKEFDFVPRMRPGESFARIFNSSSALSEPNLLNNIAEALSGMAEGRSAESERSPVERRLLEMQERISYFSMHLPKGFTQGLNRQFANLMGEDAWEEQDELPELSSLDTFLNVLHSTASKQRPGIGTNGRGSISAFWGKGDNSLTIECLSNGNTTWALTRTNADGKMESAVGDCLPERIREVLQPYGPEVWFD